VSILLTYTSNPHRALYFISPYSFSTLSLSIFARYTRTRSSCKKILNLIAQDASFSTSGYIVSHLWGRRNIIGLEVMQMKDAEGKLVDVD